MGALRQQYSSIKEKTIQALDLYLPAGARHDRLELRRTIRWMSFAAPIVAEDQSTARVSSSPGFSEGLLPVGISAD